VSAPGMTSEIDTATPDRATSHATTARARTTEEWVAGFVEGWQARGGPDAFAAHFRQLLADDVRLIQPQLPTIVGFDAFERRFVRPLFALIPDLYGDVERWAARDDTLYIELTLRGTLGRRALAWRACDRIALRDGLAVERESYYDPTPLLAALARTPRSWPRFARLRAPRLSGTLTGRAAR
jgi:SnoaL-like domain